MRLLIIARMVCLVAGAPWEKLGPKNIGDDRNGQGYAGTVADASSPVSNPNIIYIGGHNNGAASGVLKSEDRGQTWVPVCNGLWDTRIASVLVLDDKGDHVLAGSPTGIYESLDAGASWRLIPETMGIGWARTLKVGKIQGEPHVIAGVDHGLANVPLKDGTPWSLIKVPRTTLALSRFISVADVLPSSVVGVCLGGVAYLISITNNTSAEWKNTSLSCMEVAIDPRDADHFIYSNHSSLGKQTWESKDGGKTHHNLHNHYPFHVAIDRRGWLYAAAEAGAHRSRDGGKTWEVYGMTTAPRFAKNATSRRVPMDYQRIVTDFAGDGVAFPADQGVFIKPDGDSLELIGACGNLSNNIAISVAVSEGDGQNRWLVTTAWDWGPLASWDGGAHWPGWHCSDCGGQSGIGEGGYTIAMGRSNHVLMIHHANVLHSSAGGKNFTRVRAPERSFPPPIFTTAPHSRSEPSGKMYTIMGVPPRLTANDGFASAEEEGEEKDVVDSAGTAKGMMDSDATALRYAQDRARGNARGNAPPAQRWIVKNNHFGSGPFDNKTGWVWGAPLPVHLLECGLTTNPADGSTLYAVTSSCIATTHDEGQTWSPCWTGVDYPISGLLVKDSQTMFVTRREQVPMRTRDGGRTWRALESFAPIATAGFGMDLSWTGRTMMVHGVDMSKIAKGQRAVFVWRTTDDGETFVDETDDLITIHPAGGHWFNGKYYISSSGQGILAKQLEN